MPLYHDDEPEGEDDITLGMEVYDPSKDQGTGREESTVIMGDAEQIPEVYTGHTRGRELPDRGSEEYVAMIRAETIAHGDLGHTPEEISNAMAYVREHRDEIRDEMNSREFPEAGE